MRKYRIVPYEYNSGTCFYRIEAKASIFSDWDIVFENSPAVFTIQRAMQVLEELQKNDKEMVELMK